MPVRCENAEVQRLHELYLVHVRDWILFERALLRCKMCREAPVLRPTPERLATLRGLLDQMHAACDAHIQSGRAYMDAFQACGNETLQELRALDPLIYLDDMLELLPDLTCEEALVWLRQSDCGGPDPRAALEHAFTTGKYGLRRGTIIFRRTSLDNS